jgi:hypothetical protein
MDNLVFEESINTELSSSEFVDKQWLYVNDNNNTSYSGQVVIDTTSLSNCGSYINWSEAFLAFPMVLQAQVLTASLSQNTALDWFMGLKNGYWQILHSLIVEFNNGSVVQQTPFLNVFSTFKNLTSWSQNDLQNWSALTGFYPDTSTSWLYNNASDAQNRTQTNLLCSSGVGISNNRTAPFVSNSLYISLWTNAAVPSATTAAILNTFPTSAAGGSLASNNIRSKYNAGLSKRMSFINQDPATATYALGNQSNNQTALTTGTGVQGVLYQGAVSGYSAIFQAYTSTYVQGNYTDKVIIFDAIIRLKDVCDFFCKCPLLKGSTMRLYMNTNQTYFTMAVNQGAVASTAPSNALPSQYGAELLYAFQTLTSTPIVLGGGGTCPIMVASSDIGQGAYPIAPLGVIAAAANVANSVAVSVGLSIVKTQFSQFGNASVYSAPVTAVRLYAPAYTMSPISEQRYLSLAPTKKLVYNDIFYYTFQNIAASSTFSFLVTNGIPNLRGCLVVPVINKASNGTAPTQNANANAIAGATSVASILSPFSTTGGSPDPISITNFNIQVSGKNLFINNLLYDYETFTEQIVSSNQLNGGLTTSLSSGLIGLEDFEGLYRYYYGNVSRSIPSEDGVAKAVQILGSNNSPVAVDMLVFLEFERSVTIDVRTGARIA